MFLLADADGDGVLSEAEHFDFQHPEESASRALRMHLLSEDIRDRSTEHAATSCARRAPDPWFFPVPGPHTLGGFSRSATAEGAARACAGP